MKKQTNRLRICLILGVVMCALAVGSADARMFGIWRSKKKAEAVPRQSLVVFPFDRGAVSSVPDSFGDYVAADVRSMLSGNQRYSAYLYDSKLPPIRRAKGDNTLKDPDVVSPFADDKSKSLRLAQLLATDYYIVGAIDDCQIDGSKKVAEITLRADLFDARTGKVVRTFLVTGRTPDSVKTSEEDELRDIAKGVAVTKLVAELNSEKAAQEKAAEASAAGDAAAKPVEKPAENPASQPEPAPAK